MGRAHAGSSHGTGPIPMPKVPTNVTTLRMAQMAVHDSAGMVAALTESAPIDTIIPTVDTSSSACLTGSVHQPGGQDGDQDVTHVHEDGDERDGLGGNAVGGEEGGGEVEGVVDAGELLCHRAAHDDRAATVRSPGVAQQRVASPRPCCRRLRLSGLGASLVMAATCM